MQEAIFGVPLPIINMLVYSIWFVCLISLNCYYSRKIREEMTKMRTDFSDAVSRLHVPS